MRISVLTLCCFVPLAASVLYSPLLAIGAYFALGAVVLASRLLFPKPTDMTAAGSELAPAIDQRESAEAA